MPTHRDSPCHVPRSRVNKPLRIHRHVTRCYACIVFICFPLENHDDSPVLKSNFLTILLSLIFLRCGRQQQQQPTCGGACTRFTGSLAMIPYFTDLLIYDVALLISLLDVSIVFSPHLGWLPLEERLLYRSVRLPG